MVQFRFFSSRTVVQEPISKELDRVDLIGGHVACSFFISAAGRYTDSPMQWFYSHCLKIILQFVDVSKLMNVILLVFLAFLYSRQKHSVKSSSLLAPHESLL